MSFGAADSVSGDLVNTTVDGRFIVEGVIGSGATGVVYRARHALMAKTVALKVIQDDVSVNPKTMERFKREIQAISMLDHESIVKPMACGLLPDGRAYLAMDLVDGQSIAQILDQGGTFGQLEVAKIGIKICEALSHAHQCGVVHRDISPRNIVVVVGDGAPVVKILDFGISALADSPEAQTTTSAKGSPHYMSPEQCLQQQSDARSDIYSLGCVMYEMLAGCTPYDAESAFELMYKHAHDPVPAFPSAAKVDKNLAKVVMRCLEKKQIKRFDSMDSLARALDKCVKYLPGKPVATEGAPRMVLRPGPKKLGKSMILAMAICLAGSGLILFPAEQLKERWALFELQAIGPEQRLVWLKANTSAALKAKQLELALLLNKQSQVLPGLDFYERESLLVEEADILTLRGETEAAQQLYLTTWRDLGKEADQLQRVKPVDQERVGKHISRMIELYERLRKDSYADRDACLYLNAMSQHLLGMNAGLKALPILESSLIAADRANRNHELKGITERLIALVYLQQMKLQKRNQDEYARLAIEHFRNSIDEFMLRNQLLDIHNAQSLIFQSAMERYFGRRELADSLRNQGVKIMEELSVEQRLDTYQYLTQWFTHLFPADSQYFAAKVQEVKRRQGN